MNDYYQRVYSEGYESFYEGKLDCPFEENSRQSKEWQRGFNDAYFEQQKVRYA